MEKTRRILLAEMCASLLVAAIIVVLFECGVLPAGALSPNTQTTFIATLTMQIITIGAIPLALYMFRISFIDRQLKADSSTAASSLLRWGSVRMLLLCLPMIANVLLYYLTSLTVSFAYLAIILAVSLAFVYPSADRCRYETSKEDA